MAMETYTVTLASKSGGTRMTDQVGAHSPNEAMRLAENRNPGYRSVNAVK